MHHGTRVYLEDTETGLWWTRDDDQHGKSTFKTYTLNSANLEHQADRDAAGEVIVNKHKGPQGKIILASEMHSCSKSGDKHLK